MNVFVTGGSRGMGAAILEAFAAAGAVCVVNYFDDPAGQNRRDAEETAERLRALHAPAVHLIEADVSRYEAVERLNFQGMFYRRDIGDRALRRDPAVLFTPAPVRK